MQNKVKSALEKDFIHYVNIVLSIVLNLILFIFLSVLLSVSILIIYFSQHEDKFSNYIEDKMVHYLLKQGADNIQIKDFTTDFTVLYFEVAASTFNTKFKDEFDLETHNLKVKIYYLPLFVLKLKTKIDADFISFTNLFSPTKKAQYSFNFRSLLLFFRSAHVDIKHLFISDKQEINFANLLLYSRGRSANDINFRFNGSTLMYFENNDKKTRLQFDCSMQSLTKCDFNMKDLDTEEIHKINTLTGNPLLLIKDYFTFERGNIQDFNVKAVFSNGRNIKNFFAELKFDDLSFKMPFLEHNNRFEIESGQTIITKENEEYKVVSNFLLTNQKEISSTIKYDSVDTIIDIYGKNFDIFDVDYYWPEKYLKEVRHFLQSSIKAAKTEYVKVHFLHSLNKQDDLEVKVKFHDANLYYSPHLPPVLNASGVVTVDTTNNVVIDVEEAIAGNIIAKNAKAIFNVEKNFLYIDTKFSGNVKDLIKFFTGKVDVSLLDSNINGEAFGKLNLGIYINSNVEKTFEATKFNATFDVLDLYTPVMQYKKTVQMKVAKDYKTNYIKLVAESKESAPISNACNASVNAFGFDLFLDLESGMMNFEDLFLKSKNTEIMGEISTNFRKRGFFNFTSFSAIKFCNNDFSFFLNPNTSTAQIKAEKINVPELAELNIFKNFALQMKKREEKLFLQKIINTSLNINIKNLYLYNEEHLSDIKLENKRGAFIDIIAKKDDKEFVKVSKNNVSLIVFVEDVSKLLNGFAPNKQPLTGGKLTVLGKVLETQELEGVLQLQNYTLLVPSGGASGSTFDFSSKELKSEFKTEGDIVQIKSMRFANIFHTVNIQGDVNIKTDALELTAIYTPSTLDINNLLDKIYLKDVFNKITFGTLEKGLLALVYDVKGTILHPQVTFNGASTSTNIAKTGTKVWASVIVINVVLIPVITLLLLIF